MTVRIPSAILLALAFVVASSIISFAVAFAVNEWRGGKSGYIDCITRVQATYLDESDKHRGERPVGLEAPGSGASSAAFGAYQQQFTQYQAEFDTWVNQGDDMSRRWIDGMRVCA